VITDANDCGTTTITLDPFTCSNIDFFKERLNLFG